MKLENLSLGRRARIAPVRRFLLMVVAIGWTAGAAQAQYNEKFEAWTSTSAGAWQTKSLSAGPFSVPAGAVVEVAIRNSNASASRMGGVRAVGSTLERRVDLHEAAGGGVDVFTMHVQTDASSQIQHYAENTTDVDFVLLGYWDCGTYVERFQLFNSSSSWNDRDLNTYGVAPGGIAEIVMVNEHNNAQHAGVRTNGSTIDRRVLLYSSNDGTDAVTMMVKADNSASATIEAYAGHVNQTDFYLVGYWSVAPGSYTEAFTDLGSPSADATWEDKDLTSSGVPDGEIAEVLLANDWTTEENQLGVRTNGSSLSRLLNLKQDVDGDGDFGRMHVLSDAGAVIEFRHQDVSDTHKFRLLGYWTVGVILSDHPTGQEADAFHENGAETNAELFSFTLAPCSGSQTYTQVVFRLSGISGLVNGDWAGVELLIDANLDGNIGTGETTAVGGAGVVNQAAGTITFSTSFTVSATTRYILRADFASLSVGDQVTIGLAPADFTPQPVTGSTTSVTHKEKIECYFEKFETWVATSAATWQTQSLAGAPYSVPANAIVEVAVRNVNTLNERSGGVRAVGSVLERRMTLHEAEDGGFDWLVMHVQTNASSQIQHYAEIADDISFVLLGYWTCGAYVEAFDTFTAGASGAWTDKNLCASGIGPGHVSEIVMTNDDPANEREVGVRTNGSALQRKLNLHQAKDGGVDTATMFVEVDTSTGSTIELYAQDDTDVDFYLVGYWSEAPLAYTELFTDVGSPGSSATWQDVDLTASGVTDTAHVEMVLSNEDTSNERSLGVRENGSSLGRLTNIHESEGGGSDLSRMHVVTDVTATIEWYHSNIASTNSFYLVGQWTPCNSASSYVITDLGAITSTKLSAGLHVNTGGKVVGYEEDSSGNPAAWQLSCGTFTALGTLGGAYAEAHGINDSNIVAGWANIASGHRRAFRWTSGGGMVNLGVISGRTDSEALAVNSSGEVVGSVLVFAAGAPAYDRLGFIYLPADAYGLLAGMNSLGTLGGTQSLATDINDSGQVVGGAHDVSGNFRPFRWQGTLMTDLGTLGGDSKMPDHRAEAINANGDVCGRSYTAASAKRAFFWDGTMTNLGVLTGGSESWAFGINNSNVVVGTSNVTGGAFRAFVWDAVNGLRDLNDLIPAATGWTLIRANDVNNNGAIVGWGTNGSGNSRAFLLTPTCKAGGGAASASASVLSSGGGETDDDGIFDESAVGPDGFEFAHVAVVGSTPGLAVEYQLIEPTHASAPMPQPDTATSEGFVDGVSLRRTLVVGSPDDADATVIVASMNATASEIAGLGVTADELQLHVYLPSTDERRGYWAPAGRNIGESAVTDEIGDSGYTLGGDGVVSYWAVRKGSGVFAVGKGESPPQDVDQPHPTRAPRMCGLAVIQPLMLCAMLLWFVRRARTNGEPRDPLLMPAGVKGSTQV